jgi:hypothetical protein
MKQLLVILFIFCFYPALAQKPAPYFTLRSPQIQFSDSLKKLLLFNHTVNAPAPGVYKMPLDGMPCIVPDTKELAVIPNAWKSPITIPYSGTIPNPAIPRIFTFRYKDSR